MSRKLGTALFVIGAILIVAGLVIMFVIVPSMKKFPDDVDTTRRYEVSSLRLLDPDSMSFIIGDLESNPDLRVDRRFKTEEVDGDLALVSEERTIYDGDVILIQLNMHHVINRETMLAETDIPDEWRELEGYWDREGVALGWPIGSEKEDYVGWSDDYREAVDLVYVREEEHGGIDTLFFTSESESRPIAPEHIETLGLPTSLSDESLQSLANTIADQVVANAGDSEEEQQAAEESANRIRTLLPILINQGMREIEGLSEVADGNVPLEYTYEYYGEYWVEPTTGVLINTHKIEKRYANLPPEMLEYLSGALADAGGDPEALTSLLPVEVSSYEYIGTDETVEEARQDAEDVIGQLDLFGTYVPVGMILIGAFLLLIGGYGAIREDAPPPDKPDVQAQLSVDK